MANPFFGFPTSLSNLNDDEGGGGGEGSEGEYDALNDETFGHGNDELDWESEHEQLAHQLESSRRQEQGIDDISNLQLEASLSQLVLDETDAPHHTLGSSVWRHDPPVQPPVPLAQKVCTVEELERQLRQKPPYNQNYFQPRFPVILQRPPGLQGPVPLPYAPQQPLNNMNQMGQPLNNILNQNPQMTQNQMMPHHVNQLGPNVNQLGPNVNQLGPNVNQLGQNMSQLNVNQMTQNVSHFMQHSQMGPFQHNHNQTNMLMTQNMHQNNQMMQNQLGLNQLAQNHNQHGQNHHQLGQNHHPMGQNMSQIGHNVNHIPQGNPMGHNVSQMPQNTSQMGQNTNQMAHNMNQMGPMGPNTNQMPQNVGQMGHNVNHVMPNGNQFGQMNQFQHMMGQNRMMMPPPGLNLPRQNFPPNMGQFNHNFRGPIPKQCEQLPNMNQQTIMDKQMAFKSQLNPQNMHNQNMSQNMNQMGQNMGQMGQNNPLQPNTNISPNKGLKLDKKPQNRSYNNSKPQNSMTSQNLVQLIQNTHPMLQFNNSFHNATYHPLLNRTSQYSNIHHPMLSNSNQRHGGNYNSNTGMCGRRSIMNGDRVGNEKDEYAGLMTQREKQWLMNIQMLQLNTGTPYIHDFYYTVFLERQAKKEKEGMKEAHKVNQRNHPFYSGGVAQEPSRRERHNSVRHNSTSEDAAPRAYVPTQFENSLGKLQCGSVTAPRKIIDLEVVPVEQPMGRGSRAASVASTTNPTEVPREIKRTKQLLLDIESLYMILLRLEELNDPLAISNALILKEREEKQRQLEAAHKETEREQEDDSNVFLKNIESVQRRPKQESPKSETIDKRQVVNLAVSQKPPPVKNLLDENRDDLINKLFIGLLHGDKLTQILAVRKGRTLLSRFVSRVPSTHQRLRALWWRVLRATPSLARRAPDGTLAPLSPALSRYIENSTGWATTLECCSVLSEALDPARIPYALTLPLVMTAVCALVEKAATLVNTPEATANERQWSKFLKTLALALKNTTLTVAKPLHPLPESKLTYHLKQIDSRSTIEILKRGKSPEFADLTKIDVHEQLVKHLCL